MTTMTTPRITKHARERCAEMEFPVRVALQIAEHGEVRYPGTPTRDGAPTRVVLWSGEPEYCVVMDEAEEVVITVLFRTTEYYARAGNTYIPVSAAGCQGSLQPGTLDVSPPETGDTSK